MSKSLKNKKLLFLCIVICFLCLFTSCILFCVQGITANADSNIEVSKQKRDNEILKNYHEPTIDENFEDNIVNIIFKKGYSGKIGFDDFKSVEYISEISAIKYDLKTIYKGNKEKFTVSVESSILTLELSEHDKEKVIKIIEQLNKFDMILVSVPNYIYETVFNWVRSDTYYTSQWGLRETYGINIEDAWNITTGSYEVKVGLLENGADYNHEDLTGHIFSGNITGSSTNDHGTHVAGIIGATHNNYGIAGISYCSMYMLDYSIDKFADSLRYASENGIKVINASLAYIDKATGISKYNPLHYAAIEEYDGVLICSAGNQYCDTDSTPVYPACYDLPNIISVGSINYDGEKSDFSNYGKTSVDLYAPGETVLSTYPQELCTGKIRETRWGNFLSCECELSFENNINGEWKPNGTKHCANGYHYASGTSMAAPHVTGVAALLLSQDPTLTAAELKEIILSNADDITISTPKGSQNVKKLNAYKAVEALERDYYTVTLHYGNNLAGKATVNVAYGEQMPLPSRGFAPVSSGYTFVGYFSGENGTGTQYYSTEIMTQPHSEWDVSYYEGLVSLRKWDRHCDGDLYGYWRLLELDYTYENVILNEGYLASSIVEDLKHGVKTIIKAETFEGYTFKYFDVGGVQKESAMEFTPNLRISEADGKPYLVNGFFAVYEKNPCVAEGTLITLANGEQVAVENLQGNEMLLVWNLHKGAFDTAPILFIDSDPPGNYEVINLSFSDGTTVKVISEHGFWDYDLNKYVYLDKNAENYIGHWFNKGDTKVQLTEVEIKEEYTTPYSPVTYGHLCYYVDGMLSMPGGISGLFNIFDVDSETMMYDEVSMQLDIDTYGLFTYEEFYELYNISEEVFEAFNGQYLKVAIGKGLISYEQIQGLIDRYGNFFE